MLLSVVIPVYKVEKYLEECVESILAQTFKDYEIILVDDGSPDRCPEICDNYAEKYDFIKVIHKKNGGQADARNMGTIYATGEYIVYIDSDDYINDKTFFEKLSDKAKSNPDLILYKFQKYYEKDKKTLKCNYSLSEMDKFHGRIEIIKELSKRDAFYCSAWSKAIRQTVIKDNGIQFKKGVLCEDIEWFYNILCVANSFEFIDEAIITYRQRENSVTSSAGEQNLSDNLVTLEYLSNRIMQMNEDDKFKSALLGSMAKLYSNLLISYSRAGNWKRTYKKRICKLSFLLKDTVNPRAKVINKIYNVIGFNGTIAALKIMDKIKH